MLRIHVFATGKYIQFVKPLIESAKTHLKVEHEFAIHTDQFGIYQSTGQITYLITKTPWPIITMLRYHCILDVDYISSADHHMLLDADMLFQAPVGEEILSPLTLVAHPGFFRQAKGFWPYETNPNSAACVNAKTTSSPNYFAGGVVIGERERFMDMARTIASQIDVDLKKHVIATWHDESHLNAYAVRNPPAKILSPEYCYSFTSANPGLTPRIVALDKTNPAEMRG